MNTPALHAARGASAALLVATCVRAAPSFAATATDPIFTPLLVQTIAPAGAPCADSAVSLFVHLSDPCLRVVSFTATTAPPVLLVRRVSPGDSQCRRGNTDRRFNALGRFTRRARSSLRVRTEVPNDSGYAVSWQDRPLSFVVRPSCPRGHDASVRAPVHDGQTLLGGAVTPLTCAGVPTTVRFGVLSSSCEHYLGSLLPGGELARRGPADREPVGPLPGHDRDVPREHHGVP